MTAIQKKFKRKLIVFCVLFAFFMFSLFCLRVYKLAAQTVEGSVMNPTVESDNVVSQAKAMDPGIVKFAFIAAAIAVGFGSIGAGVAVGYVGSAAVGVVGEKPELFVRALLFVGLAEGIAIYGLIISIIILGRV